MLGDVEGREANDEVSRMVEEIAEANNTSCFTNVPGASPAFIYVSGLTFLKV